MRVMMGIGSDPIVLRDSLSFTTLGKFLMSFFKPLALLGFLVAMSTVENAGWSVDSSLNAGSVYRHSASDVTYVRMRPPAAQSEQAPATLTATQAWIPGNWAWQSGTFIWRSGQLTERPSSYVRWEPRRCVPVVTRHHGWRYRPGHWIA